MKSIMEKIDKSRLEYVIDEYNRFLQLEGFKISNSKEALIDNIQHAENYGDLCYDIKLFIDNFEKKIKDHLVDKNNPTAFNRFYRRNFLPVETRYKRQTPKKYLVRELKSYNRCFQVSVREEIFFEFTSSDISVFNTYPMTAREMINEASYWNDVDEYTQNNYIGNYVSIMVDSVNYLIGINPKVPIQFSYNSKEPVIVINKDLTVSTYEEPTNNYSLILPCDIKLAINTKHFSVHIPDFDDGYRFYMYLLGYSTGRFK